MALASPTESISGSARRRLTGTAQSESPLFISGEQSYPACGKVSPWIKFKRVTLAATIGGMVLLLTVGSVRYVARAGSLVEKHSYQPWFPWHDKVAQCTGAAEVGYAHSQEAAVSNVLHFVRRKRRHRMQARDKSVASLDHGEREDVPTLEEVIRWVWNAKLAAGVLWFTVSDLKTRVDVGKESGWECIFAANPGRSKKFPPPEPAEMPWDDATFNFYHADPLEFMFEYTPSFRYEEQISSAEAMPAKNHGRALEGDNIVVALPRRRVDDKLATLLRGGYGSVIGDRDAGNASGASRGLSADSVYSASSPSVNATDPMSVECGEISGSSPPRDVVLVNVRPVGPVSVLLMPGYSQSLHQRATPYALAVAMDFSEALMSAPGFRLGFNSGGSSASVNHLHFQCWHFDAGPRGLPLEVAKTVYQGTLPLHTYMGWDSTVPHSDTSLEVHMLHEGYPLRGLVFHTLGKDLRAAGAAICKCIDVLLEKDIPHTMLFSQGRAFLLPRQPLKAPPFAAVIGFPEVSGEVIITSESDFRTVTADDVFRFWRESITVGPERFDDIRRACLAP